MAEINGERRRDRGRPGHRPGGRLPLLPFSPEELKLKRQQWTIRSREALPSMARAYAIMALGCLLMAAGYSFFMIPQKIAPGGVYGIATVLHYASGELLGRSLPTGALGLVLNIPLFFWGLRALGARFVARTLFGMILASVFMDVLSYLIPRAGWEAVILGLDPMLASLFGGLAIGTGLGLVFRNMGSTGGTDIIGQILGTKTNTSVGVWMMVVDAVVVLLAAFYFRNLNLSLYAVVTIFVTGRVIDSVLEGRSHSRAVTIVTERGESIREAIVFGLDKTGTLLEGHGLYRGQRKNVFLCVVNRKQLIQLEQLVAKADPAAFLVVSKAHEVLGEGFRPLKDRLPGATAGI
ncbi:MAG: YitT family protein [Candidatus Eisenbacteria sp.]|nr:YitT family protein [Candidatus Eisenbacteria bacterium]